VRIWAANGANGGAKDEEAIRTEKQNETKIEVIFTVFSSVENSFR
jgi:hypothetical protein